MQKIGEGIECEVFDAGDSAVYKKYRQPENARFAFELQTLASKHNLAPKTISFDEIGYYSEKVFVLEKIQSQNRIFNWQEIDKEKEKLREKLEVLFGEVVNDLHRGNIGITKKGFICIDFGIGFTHTQVMKEYKEIKRISIGNN